mmetsp:Transcript_33481/g.72436  ORF Transcript_33481/g.72436 Transcript_33481/m.72436 type:complete len:169 (+) Transcript_33481:85-591(+)
MAVNFADLKIEDVKITDAGDVVPRNKKYEAAMNPYPEADVHAPKKIGFSTNWEKLVAYHHGVYVPEMAQGPRSSDEVCKAVADFSEKVHKDAPKDACKYLQIEEFRCLNAYQYESQPQVASKKCMKWWNELQKCQWDQAKFNAGTTYIEGPQMRRRRPYIFYPDFKYA